MAVVLLMAAIPCYAPLKSLYSKYLVSENEPSYKPVEQIEKPIDIKPTDNAIDTISEIHSK
jgi:hypothetical protein